MTSLLYDTQTRPELACEITILQQYNNSALVVHLKQANKLIEKAQTDAEELGLYYPKLDFPLRIVSVCDASHATGKTSYAQEGKLTLLMSDKITSRYAQTRSILATPTWSVASVTSSLAPAGSPRG